MKYTKEYCAVATNKIAIESENEEECVKAMNILLSTGLTFSGKSIVSIKQGCYKKGYEVFAKFLHTNINNDIDNKDRSVCHTDRNYYLALKYTIISAKQFISDNTINKSFKIY